jgi:RNA polymerase sigma-32 factor
MIARAKSPAASEAELVAEVSRAVHSRAFHWAGRYRLGNGHIDDLVAEGNIGALRAARRFDPGRGVKFLTYAYPWIDVSIQNFAQERTQAVRIPLNLHRTVRRQLQRLDPATQTGAVLAAGLLRGGEISLFSPANRDATDGGVLLDLLPMEQPSPEEIAIATQEERRKRGRLRQAIQTLPAAQRVAIRGRLAGKTLREIATELDCSPEWVSQLADKAIARVTRRLAAGRSRT